MPAGRRPPLVGRARELAILREVYAGSSGVRVVVVHGEAGVGKTALVRRMTDDAAAAGVVVAVGRAHRFGGHASPYLPLVSALTALRDSCSEAHRGEIDALVASIEAKAHGDDAAGAYSGRLVRQIGAAFARAAADRPVVVVVDDVQWADSTTLEVLAYLADGPDSERLSLVVVYRDEGLPDGHPLHAWLVDLGKALPVRSVPLGRLDHEATAEQVVALLGLEELGRTSAVHAASRGNPYLTELLCRDLLERREDTTQPDPASAGLHGVSTLREVLLASWHRLSPAARAVTRAASIAGRPSPVDLVVRAAEAEGTPAAEAEAALAEGIASGLLTREPGGDIWFRHPLAAEILEASMMPAEASRLHLALADELGRRTGAGGVRADHALHVAAAGDPRVAFDLCREASAREKASGSREEAARLFRRVVELRELLPDEPEGSLGPVEPLPGLLVELATQLLELGDFAGAVEAIDRAHDLRDEAGDPVTAGRIVGLQAQLHRFTGLVTEPDVQATARAVELTSVDPTGTPHVLALAWHSEELRITGRHDLAQEAADRAVAASRRRDDPLARSWALMSRLTVSPSAADRADLKEVARSSQLVEAQMLDAQQAGFAAIYTGEWEEAVAELGAGFEVGIRSGATAAAQVLGGYLAMFQVPLGHTAQAREVLRLVLAGRPTGMCGVVARSQALVIAVRAGEDRRAQVHLRWLRELVDSFEDMVGLWGPTVLAEHHLENGRPQDAFDVLADRVESHASFEPVYGDIMLVWAARAAHQVCERARGLDDPGGVERALAALDEAVAARDRVEVGAFAQDLNPVSVASRASFEAERAACAGSSDLPGVYRAAAEASLRAGLRHDAALAMLAEAAFLVGRRGRAGGRVEGAVRLREAHRLALDIGSTRLGGRVEELARAARLSLAAPATPPPRPARPAGITDREVEVLHHLAAGRTYAEIARTLFISEKTVSAHVSHLLRKTGTTGRTEAVEWARRHDVLADV